MPFPDLLDLLPKPPPGPPTPRFLDDIADIKARLATVETALREYGVGEPVGWTDEVDTKLVELATGLGGSQTEIAEISHLLSLWGNRFNAIGNELDALANKIVPGRGKEKDWAPQITAISNELKAIARKFKALGG